jgi:hypothetical protein
VADTLQGGFVSDRESLDLFRVEQPPRERQSIPHNRTTPSREAADRIAPLFSGNRLTCFRAIASAGMSGGITRKQIAQRYFENLQNYVTGPVAVLIAEGYVYEAPEYDRNGAIQKRSDGSMVPRRIDGSAVLLLTSKGKARAAA